MNIFTIVLLSFFTSLSIQHNDTTETNNDKQWEVEGTHWDDWPTETLSFQTDEGTWMNLDVSPDGRHIVFDLLGNIYKMDIGGGEAELLSGGQAYDIQPRFSPDGNSIAFTSDRDGGDNIWLMDADGENRRALTSESFRLLSSPNWTPDGNYLIARKHFTGTRSLGAGEMWMYHVNGGNGIKLTDRQNWQADQNEPAVSPDGRWLYYTFFTGNFDYNRDVHAGIYQVNRLDRETGRMEPVTRTSGGAVRPTPSPDGEKLAFIRRVGTNTTLFIRDLETGAERMVFDGLDRDQQETWAILGLYPSYAWMPGSDEIVITYGGKIHRLNIESGETREIPFTAHIDQKIAKAVTAEFPIEDGSFQTKMVRWPSLTPDGSTLVFQAVGRLYKMDLPNGTPQRITGSDEMEYAPSVSPDGRWISYVTWNDSEGGGHVKKARLNGRRSPVTLTDRVDQYTNPTWSPDGNTIAFLQGSGTVHRSRNLSGEFFLNIKLIDANGGEVRHVTETGNRGANRRMARLTWKLDGSRIYFHENERGNTLLSSVQPDGSDKKQHVTNDTAEEIVLSPNGEFIAFKEAHNVYVAPMPLAGGDPVLINAASTGVPARKLTNYGGDWVNFSADSKDITFVLGSTVYRQAIAAAYRGAEDNEEENNADDDDWRYANVNYAPQVIPVELTFEKEHPEGVVAYTQARIITMNGDEVIENGTVIVNGNRIAEVGAANQVSIPEYAQTINLEGKTIMPGIVDVHAHMGYVALDITPDRLWEYEANLAYGVTTTHDPSASTQAVFALAEQVEAGRMIGPRIYSTGYILYGADNPNKALIESLDDARAHMRRHKAQGAISVKSYNQPRRNQRQWVLQAAREEGMLVFPEGGSVFQHNMNMIIDGHTGIEHAIPITPFYTDAISLFGEGRTTYTPTLGVGYGGIWGENYWYQQDDVYRNERLLQFVPREFLDARARRRMLVPDDEFHHFELAKTVKQILDAGGKIQLGAHGQLQGLAAHWEIWMFEQGGMTNLEAIRAATLHGAQYIGLGRDLGSIEENKLADFIILDENPLENIRNTENIHMVVKDGRVWDTDLNELHPTSQKRRSRR